MIIKNIIIDRHRNKDNIVDESQTNVIFSDNHRIMVEAPAGYGKTRTLISKIAYLISSEKLKYPKKILALSFSVSAAYNIKKEIIDDSDMSDIFQIKNTNDLKKYIYTTNYHGFCRRILFLYGYLINPNLKKDLRGLGDDKFSLNKFIKHKKIKISGIEQNLIIKFGTEIQKNNLEFIIKNKEKYLEIIEKKLLPTGYITYNSILLFAIKLLEEYPKISNFYHNYFPIIVIDEYQDTNVLNKLLLDNLIVENTSLVFMGDDLQRIYGFIGAIPNLIDKSVEEYSMKKYKLDENYRFENNGELKRLDHYLRGQSISIKNLMPNKRPKPQIELYSNKNQREEIKIIIKTISNFSNDNPEDTIALLLRNKINSKRILAELNKAKIDYFDSLFFEDDIDYQRFHSFLSVKFSEILDETNNNFNKNISNKLIIASVEYFKKNPKKTIHNSLLKLLKSFLKSLFEEYKVLSKEEKINYVYDTLNNKSLNKFMKHIDEKVIISTIHGAKGLEWDSVILADVEKGSFPHVSICNKCSSRRFCDINMISINQEIVNEFLEEFSVFYVGCTRAKKNLIFTFSNKLKKSNISCFLKDLSNE